MAYANEVKRDCIFYENYRDMGASMDALARSLQTKRDREVSGGELL